MAFKFQVMFVFLIIATTFIAAIPLVRYLSTEYFPLQGDNNSESNSLKYSSSANGTPIEEKVESQKENKNTLVSRKYTGVAGNFKLPDVLASSSPIPVKVKKRSKRQAISQQKDLFSWNFNLNVSRYPNIVTVQETTKNGSDSLLENKHLAVALHVEGKAQRQTALKELQNALKSAQTYVKGVFENAMENETYEGVEIKENQLLSIENKYLKTNSGVVYTNNLNNVEFETNNQKSLIQKGREGKFIFELLGFNRKTLDETTTFSEKDTIFPTEQDRNSNAFRKKEEFLENARSLKTEFVTENQQRSINFSSESLLSKTESPVMVFEEEDSLSHFNFQRTTQQDECTNCVTESVKLSELANEKKSNNTISETGVTAAPLFTDELLENFCTSLVNQLEESRQLPEDGNDFDPEFNSQNEHNQLRSSQNSSIMGLLLLFNSLKGKESNTDSSVIEDSFLVSDESKSQSSVSRQSRFFDFNNIFGSGRSAIIEESKDLISRRLVTNNIEDWRKLPSVLDCESYFRKKQSTRMYPKPTLTDMIDDPKIELEDFANATISTKLPFLTDLLQNNLNNTEAFDNAEDTVEKPENNSVPSENVSSFTVIEDKFIGGSKEILNETESIAFQWYDKSLDVSTDSDYTVHQTTQIQRDGRFFNIFGFGSGDERQLKPDSRLFISLFGSGGRSLETTDTVTESSREEFGSGDELEGNIDLFSDARVIDASSKDLLEVFSTTSVDEGRMWGMFGFGSGDGRSLIESVDIVSSESEFSIENDCTDDCTHDIHKSATPSHDCKDGNCSFADHENNFAFTKDILNDDCNDCYPEIANDNSYDYTESVGTDFSMEPNSFDNLTTENTHAIHENCNCLHENSTGSFSQCDNCNFNVIDLPAELYQITENYESKISENLNRAKKAQDHENDCHDCGPGNDFHSKKEISNSSSKQSFWECDECNSDVIDSPAESYEIIENYQSEERKLESNVNKIKLGEDYEDGCFDCEYENDLYNKKLTNNAITGTDVFGSFNTSEVVADQESISYSTIFHLTDIGNEYITYAGEKINTDTHTEPSDTTENPRNEQTTEMKPRRFMGTIFLTGSGDGNLFEDNGGQINLVEEESTIVSPIVFPRRRGRLHDEGVPCDDCDVDISDMIGNNLTEFGQIEPTQGDTSNGSLSTFEAPKLFQIPNVDETEQIVSSEIFQSSTDVSKTTKKLQTRLCGSASECNSTLNERCVTVNSSSVCGCSRGYVRHRETSKCVVKQVIEISLKFPAEEFNKDLENPLSPRYKQMREYAIDTMWQLLHDKPELLSLVADVDIARFRTGSLIVTWNLAFAAESYSEVQLIINVENNLKKAIKYENLMKRTSLDISDASVLPIIIGTNPCKSSLLNYCSENAYCVWNEGFLGRYSCYCKKHYRDVSSNALYIGETCIAKCPPEYCGPYGHCEILANDERHCLCSGLYFGNRCEIPGMVVLVILAIAASISIAVLFAVAFRKRCRATNGGSQTFHRSHETGTLISTNGRVSDAIALEENVGSKVTKFANISTPMQDLPNITVTRPTLNESSMSYDFDSTFDVTPASVNKMENKSTSLISNI